MYKKVLCTVFLILATSSAFAEKLSKKQLEKQTISFMKQIETIEKKVKSKSNEIVPMIEAMCELRTASIGFSKFINEQSLYYPELEEIRANEMNELLSQLNTALAYKNATICEALDF